MHKPVLLGAVLSHLKPRLGQIILDGTVGSGGHAKAILEHIGKEGLLIGLDQDEQAIERAKRELEPCQGRFVLRHSNFLDLDQILSALNLDQIDAVLLDVGVSTEQLEDPDRGFSFLREGPLDMRMDQTRRGPTACDLLRTASQNELTRLFRTFGEDRRAKLIARKIVQVREREAIETTHELKELVEKLTPVRERFGRIHPATRVFQALRIAVNRELEVLEQALPKAFERLKIGGKLAVISFHSLEDRIVKHFFVAQKKKGTGWLLTPKPIRPSASEVQSNPRSRSAKLRVMERMAQ